MEETAQASSAFHVGRRVNTAVSRYWWTLDRFGFTPRKLAARIATAEPKILCVSLPKAGTHLLERALCLHPKLYRKFLPTIDPSQLRKRGGFDSLLARLKPGQIIAAHLPFKPEYRQVLTAHGVRTIFLIRDPRDIVVSAAYFLARTRTHELYPLFAGQPGLKERIELVIKGNPTSPYLEPMSEHLLDFAGWLQASDTVVRFENLIGAQGGGDIGTQRATLRSLYRAVGKSPDEAFFDSVARRLFSSDSPTFRKGAIGQWKQHFTPELMELFRTAVDHEVVRYGYNATALP